MDLGTGLTVLGGALGSAKLLEKMLGPTADYLGTGAKDWTEKGVKNLSRIFKNAENRLGDEIEKDGQVPPKVLKNIIDNGQFCEDEVSSAYFGGILASSRTENSVDDRAITYLKLLEGMSSFQIRTHYLLYASLKQVYNGSKVSITANSDDANLWIHYESYLSALDVTQTWGKLVWNDQGKSYDNLDSIFIHSMHGLRRLNLINHFAAGGVKLLSKSFSGVPDPGLVFRSSTVGVELFLWANGMSEVFVNDFLNEEITVPLISDLELPKRMQKVETRPKRRRKRDVLGFESRKSRLALGKPKES